MIAMDQKTYELIGAGYPGNRPEDVKNPSLGWMIGFMFLVGFLGLFSLVPLRKVLFYPHMLVCPMQRILLILSMSFLLFY